jgi:hypothetical protein
LLEQQEEALVGEREQPVVVVELWDVHPDALTGGDVKKAAAPRTSERLVNHDPLTGEEAAIQDAGSRIRRALLPRSASDAEANIISHVGGECELGDEASRAVPKVIRPVLAGLTTAPVISVGRWWWGAAGKNLLITIATTAERGARAFRPPRGTRTQELPLRSLRSNLGARKGASRIAPEGNLNQLLHLTTPAPPQGTGWFRSARPGYRGAPEGCGCSWRLLGPWVGVLTYITPGRGDRVDA